MVLNKKVKRIYTIEEIYFYFGTAEDRLFYNFYNDTKNPSYTWDFIKKALRIANKNGIEHTNLGFTEYES